MKSLAEHNNSNHNRLDAKQHIFDTAKELFYRDGYESTTMRKIAQTAGVSTGLPIYYFGSKEALGVEIYKEFRKKLYKACQLLYPLNTHADMCRHFSTFCDCAILLENDSLKELFIHTAHAPEMDRFMQTITRSPVQENQSTHKYRLLNALTVSSTKANILRADLNSFDIAITKDDLLSFLFYRYIRLLEPSLRDHIPELYHCFCENYRQFQIQLTERFHLVYNPDLSDITQYSMP